MASRVVQWLFEPGSLRQRGSPSARPPKANSADSEVAPARILNRLPSRLGAIACTFALTACTAPALRAPLPPLEHSGAPHGVSPVDTLALSPAMGRFLDQYVRPYPDPDTRVQLLAMAVSSDAMLGFRYDDRATYTASEAYEARSGNCVSYANLVVALARASGLRAHFQEVALESEWEERGDTLVLPRHINVVIETRRSAWVLDASGLKFGPEARRKKLDAAEALAVYYNNLGAEALLTGNLGQAYAYLRLAIETDPTHGDAWTNLGVTYSRHGQYDAARFAYETALTVDRNAASALSNLHSLLLATGDEDAARSVARRVERHRRKNPYHLLAMAQAEIDQQRYRAAIALLERAVERKDDEPRFHFAMARALDGAGDERAAQDSLAQARALEAKSVPTLDLTPDEAVPDAATKASEFASTSEG